MNRASHATGCDLAGGYPHLVYRVVGVGAYRRSTQQFVDLLGHARCSGSVGAGAAPLDCAVAPSTRASLEPCPAGAAPASSSDCPTGSTVRCPETVRPTSSSSHSRHSCCCGSESGPRGISGPGDHVIIAELRQRSVQRAVQQLAFAFVVMRATGATGRSRTIANTTSSNSLARCLQLTRQAAHGSRCARPAGRQLQVPTGVVAAGAAAQVILLCAKSCLGCQVGGVQRFDLRYLDPATAAMPSNDGVTVDSSTSNLRSTPDGWRFWRF